MLFWRDFYKKMPYRLRYRLQHPLQCYKQFIGEPYFDIDFSEVLYLKDTGREWNTIGGNTRDKVQSKYNYNFKSTFDIIEALEKKRTSR